MVDCRFQCLVEANKDGFTLSCDPVGERNRCFYECLAKHLKLTNNLVIDMVFAFMSSNQIVSMKSKVRSAIAFPLEWS